MRPRGQISNTRPSDRSQTQHRAPCPRLREMAAQATPQAGRLGGGQGWGWEGGLGCLLTGTGLFWGERPPNQVVGMVAQPRGYTESIITDAHS